MESLTGSIVPSFIIRSIRRRKSTVISITFASKISGSPMFNKSKNSELDYSAFVFISLSESPSMDNSSSSFHNKSLDDNKSLDNEAHSDKTLPPSPRFVLHLLCAVQQWCQLTRSGQDYYRTRTIRLTVPVTLFTIIITSHFVVDAIGVSVRTHTKFLTEISHPSSSVHL